MNKLREIRVVKRISQFQLRLLTGIHQSKISMIENGLIEAREDERQKIAKALHLKVEEIWRKENGQKEGKEDL
jgi:transcriptional regulator with XRE-family HTH domain